MRVTECNLYNLSDGGTTPTIKTVPPGGNSVPDVVYAIEGNVVDRNSAKNGVCYCIEGHVVDRNTNQNGRGWAAGYSHTLNATDRHAVCFSRQQAKTEAEAED